MSKLNYLIGGYFPPVVPAMLVDAKSSPKSCLVRILPDFAKALGYSGEDLDTVLSLDGATVGIKHLRGVGSQAIVVLNADSVLSVLDLPLRKRAVNHLRYEIINETLKYTPEQWKSFHDYKLPTGLDFTSSPMAALLLWASAMRDSNGTESVYTAKVIPTQDMVLTDFPYYAQRGTGVYTHYTTLNVPKGDVLAIAALLGPQAKQVICNKDLYDDRITGIDVDPVINIESYRDYLRNGIHDWYSRNTWNIDPPSELELTDNRPMLEAVKKHLEGLPLVITGLSRRRLIYRSDGSFDLSPDAYPDTYTCPMNYHDNRTSRLDIVLASAYDSLWYHGKHSRPMLYIGEAWCLTFSPLAAAGKNKNSFAADLHVYFATPEQYIDAYKDGRPEFAEEFEKDPWGDGFIFVSSDWCQRNGTANYYKGIDLLSPRRRRCSLRDWLLTDYYQRSLSYGINVWGGNVTRFKTERLLSNPYAETLARIKERLAVAAYFEGA